MTTEVNIDIKALDDFIKKNQKHNLPTRLTDKFVDSIVKVEVNDSILLDIIKVLKSNATPLLSTELKSIEDIFVYFAKYYNKEFRKYRANEDYILFIFNVIGISLSNFSNDSYAFLDYIYDIIEEFSSFKKEAKRHIETKDLRALLFWLCKSININYDNVAPSIVYQYTAPTRKSDWLKENRKENEPIEFWFDKTSLGRSLFIVLYTAECRYHNCLGCDLPSKSAKKSSREDIYENQIKIYNQINFLLEDSISQSEKFDIKELTLSNNGNLYDTDTMPFLSLLYVVDKSIHNLPNLKKIVLESRIEVVDIENLKILKETIDKHGKNITLETAVGLEIMDDDLRNAYYKKGLSRVNIENFLQTNSLIMKNLQSKTTVKQQNKEHKNKFIHAHQKAYKEGENKYMIPRTELKKIAPLSIKFYVMYMCIPYSFKMYNSEKTDRITTELSEYLKVKGYDIPKKENQDIARDFGIIDIKEAIKYLVAEKEKRENIEISIHINPTYLTKNLEIEKKKNDGKNYHTPTKEDIKKLLENLIDEWNNFQGKINLFISTNDEGLSEEEDKLEFYERKRLNEAISCFNQGLIEDSKEVLNSFSK